MYGFCFFIWGTKGLILSTQHATPMSASLREKLKRSRRQFVSPLLSCASSKKPRLSADKPQMEQPVATKLDFTGCSAAQVEPKSGTETGAIQTGSTGTESGNTGTRVAESGSTASGITKTVNTETGSAESGNTQAWSMRHEVTKTMETGRPKSENGSGCVSQTVVLVREREALQKELEEKEERLRKLRLVKMYRSKVSQLAGSRLQECIGGRVLSPYALLPAGLARL